MVGEKRCMEFSAFLLDFLDNIEYPFQSRLFLVFHSISINFSSNVALPF